MHRLLLFRLFRCRLCGPDIVVDELIFNPDELEIEVFLECFCCFLSVTNLIVNMLFLRKLQFNQKQSPDELLEQSALFRYIMTGVVDHFNVFIVCAMESELQATKGVLENGTESKFENKYLGMGDLSTLNVRMCEKWNSTEMKVGMVAQTQMGGIECHKLVSKLAKYFTANVLAMTGICAGDENKYGHVEHGCVFVADRTTVESGGKVTEGGGYQPRALYRELDKGILASVNELVTGPSVWLEYIPENAIRPSPRYLQQLILDIVSKSGEDGITKKDLLDKLTDMKLPGMTTMDGYNSGMIYGEVLKRMIQQKSPWVSRTVKYSYIATDEGKEYSEDEYPFPREDKIKAITDCMVSIPHVNLNLKEELKAIKERVASRDVKAVDMEAHMFMEDAIDIFARRGVLGKAIVMKGIADYGSDGSRGDYFQVYAASTSAAFLRHMMTVKQHLFGNYF